MWSRELDSMVLTSRLQLRRFYNSTHIVGQRYKYPQELGLKARERVSLEEHIAVF